MVKGNRSDMVRILTILFLLLCSQCTKPQNYLLTNFGHVKPLPSPPAAPDTAYVFWLGGQSNAAGRVNVVDVDTSWMLDPAIYSGDTVWTRNYDPSPDDDNGWEVLEGGVNTGDLANRIGMQPMLGKRLAQYKGKNIYLLQATQGNAGIINWTGGGAYDMHNYCDTAIPSARAFLEARGLYVKFVAAIWYQGESNCITTDTTQYKAELDDMLDLIRDWTATPALPFIEVQLLDCQTDVTCLADMQLCQQTWAWTNVGNGVHLLPKSVGPDECLVDNIHAAFQQVSVSMPEWIFQLIKDW